MNDTLQRVVICKVISNWSSTGQMIVHMIETLLLLVLLGGQWRVNIVIFKSSGSFLSDQHVST